MNDKEFIAALKDMDNDTLMDNLEDLGGDKYYQELRFAIIAEIRKRLAVPEREKGTDLISRTKLMDEWFTLSRRFAMPYSPLHIKVFKNFPSAVPEREKGDTVSRVVYEQIMWERDIAIQQLKDLGYGLGEKPRKGEWIPVYGKNGKTIMSYKCSVCEFHPKHAIITDFCGGCGADMRKEEQ